MSGELSIKAAGAEDIAFLEEMLDLTLQTQPQFARKTLLERQALVRFEMAGWKPDRNYAFIARWGELRAGAVWLHAGGEIGARTYTLGIAVLPRFRRQQIGTRLVEHALAFCQSHQGLSLDLKVHPANEAAIRLYRRFGFEPTMLEMKKRLRLQG